MAVKPSKKPRRTDPRRITPLGRVYPWQKLGRKKIAIGLLLSMGFAVLAGAMVLYARSLPRYAIGEIVDEPIYPRVEVRWQDPTRTEIKRQIRRDETPTVYTMKADYFARFRQKLIAMPGNVAQAKSVEDVADELVEEFNLTHNPRAIDALQQYYQDGQPTAQWMELVEQFIANIKVNKVVLKSDDYQLEKAGLAWNITLTDTGAERYNVGKSRLINLQDRSGIDQWITDEAYRFPAAIRPMLVSYVIGQNEPTYEKDTVATDAAKAAAAEKVPLELVVYQPGERPLVAPGTEMDKNAYSVMRIEREQYLASLDSFGRLLHAAGPLSLVMLVTVGLVGAVMAEHRRIAENPLRGLALALLLLACLLLSVLVRYSGANVTAAAAVGATLLAAVIVTIAYNQMFSLVVATLLSILVALALRLSMGALVVTLSGCVVGIAQLGEVRKRGKLIRVALVSGLVVAAGVWAAGLTERNLYPGIYASLAAESMWAFIGGLTVGFFVLGVLPFIERAFKVTTAMTLLEWSDVNQPLLRRLAQAAPGTYNHSLSVATIAEAAADAIGANGLLVRVGTYYHDIGKMNKPQYFVENQAGGPNRHAKLSPAMSLLIIVAHVKDGMEMAREYRLPPVLHHFIESHHGTTLVEYFYHTAKQRTAEEPGTVQPSEFEFRYPGPKPQTREAAILLLSDSVEAGCRTMNEPTAGRIEQFVHTIAMKRLMDGQFDECGLTLAELARVEAALTKSLCGIYHSRIAYPTDEKNTEPEPRAAGPTAAG